MLPGAARRRENEGILAIEVMRAGDAQHAGHKLTAGQGSYYEPPGAFSPSSTSDPYRTITGKNDVGHVIGVDVALGQVFHAGRSEHQGPGAISAYHYGMQKLGCSQLAPIPGLCGNGKF